jgi:exosortase/archaeosortase family protein
MVYSCLGIGILSSWAAFAIAFPNNLKRKIIWLFAGLLTIWFANVIRVAVLLMLLNKTKDVKGFPNHHTIFNVIAYMIVIVLIYFYSKEKTVKSGQ